MGTAYSKNLLFLSIFPILLLTCSKNGENVENIPRFEVKIIDTIKVKYAGKIVKIIDYNKKNGNLLICDITKIHEIIQTDSIGRILNVISLIGEGPNEPGESIFNLGYYSDTSIVVNSSRGFFIYNNQGKLREIIKEPTPLMSYGSGVIPRIRHDASSERNLLFMHMKSSVNGPLFNEKGYKMYQPLSVFDIKSKKIKLTAGYDPESIFNRDLVYFGDPINIFDVNSDLLYSINDPEPIVYIYDVKNDFSLNNTINLRPENFSLPIKYRFGESIREDRAELIINSQIIDINSYEKNIIVTYRSGIPIEEFTEKSKRNIPRLFKKFMKYYIVYCKNGKKASHDIELPYGCTGVAFSKANNFIMLNTNPAITETENESVFYTAKIKEN